MSGAAKNEIALSLSGELNAATIGPRQTNLLITATQAECRAAADDLGVVSVPSLAATGTVTRRKDMVRLSLKITADITQTCVVTLEPLESRVACELKRVFTTRPPVENAEVDIDPLSDDPPDPLEGGLVPIRDAILEQILLEIDPYPRKEGLSYVEILDDDDDGTGKADEKASPFAALAALKDKLN
ncbi:MAG: DUF177 domain-containing protein [Rhodospirillales bacterium]